MSTGSSRRAAAQMDRDGIKRLPKWGKPKRIGCATYRAALEMPACGHQGCSKKAGYSTPLGNRCYGHAIEQASS